MTRDQLSSILHQEQCQNISGERSKMTKQTWNAFDNSDFVLSRSFPLQTFGSFHSLIIPQLDIAGQNEGRFDADFDLQKPYLTFLDDQSPICFMPYLRGWSESVEQKRGEEPLESRGFEVDFECIAEKGEIVEQQPRESNTEINTCTPLCKQELKSFSNIGQNTLPSGEQKMQPPHNKGYLSKNVTKNIGKLLIKYIWKNRNELMQKLGVSASTWDSFMTMVQKWKKENNITREFLINRWSGTSEEHRIFRILSRFFFRKECRIAILQSNIREKSIHIERMIKFDQAITEPKSLDYLS